MQFLHAFFIHKLFSGASHAIGEKGEKGGRGERQFESRAGSSGRVVCACGSCDGRNWPPCPHSGFLVAFFVITYIVWAFTVWHVAAFEILFNQGTMS